MLSRGGNVNDEFEEMFGCLWAEVRQRARDKTWRGIYIYIFPMGGSNISA